MADPIITLTTDYGLGDHLVGAVKGVILSIVPGAQIVDITHNVVPCDVLDGALAIAAAYRYFPPRTIHVVVVDPGVGTERRPILVSGEQQYFVAPDNGVLSLVYEREASFNVRHITAEHCFRAPVSKTFHGRDIFAPVAAYLAKTFQTEAFGEEITDFARFTLPKPKAAGNELRGVVLRVDAFGNLMTNFTPENMPPSALADGKLLLRVNGKEIRRLADTFGRGEAGEAIAVFGSSGFLEIAVNKGNAAKLLGAQRGSDVVLAGG